MVGSLPLLGRKITGNKSGKDSAKPPRKIKGKKGTDMLYEKIQQDRIQAMKDKNEGVRRVLSILQGEVDRNKGVKEINEDTVLATIKKMIKNAKENIGKWGPGHAASVEAQEDIGVLRGYLPPGTVEDLSEEELRKILSDLKEKHSGNQGLVMKEAKVIPGVDMTLAAKVYKTI